VCEIAAEPRNTSPTTLAYNTLTRTLKKLARLVEHNSESKEVQELIRDAQFLLLNAEAWRTGVWLDPQSDTGDEPIIAENCTYTGEQVRILRKEWERRARIRRSMNSEWRAAQNRISNKNPRKTQKRIDDQEQS
jgi:hypothetical protein